VALQEIGKAFFILRKGFCNLVETYSQPMRKAKTSQAQELINTSARVPCYDKGNKEEKGRKGDQK